LHGKNALIAEPNFKNSAYYSYGDPSLHFSDLQDFDHFNQQSRKIGYPEMINIDKFTQHSPKYAIHIHIRYKAIGAEQKIVWQAKKVDDTMKCLELDDIQELPEEYERYLQQAKEHSQMCIVRVVELWVVKLSRWDGERASPLNSIHQFIFGEWSHKEVTLIFGHWAFYVYPPMVVPPNTIDCLNITHAREQFQPSKRLIHEAMAYKDMFLGGELKLAIMLRIERVVMVSHQKEIKPLDFVKKCLDDVFALKYKLTNNSNALVTIDTGENMGSSTFRDKHNVTQFSLNAFRRLYDNRWSVKEWDKSFIKAAGGVTDKGYRAALQRVLTSRADCLVLVGGGDFQAMAVVDYTRYHNSSECMYRICETYGLSGLDKVR
jgi:hypothetical protein